MSLVFYETQTTGPDTDFDQILQFAAIKTGSEFQELDRVDIRCRLLSHVIPSPASMLNAGLRPGQLNDPILPSHYEMIRTVRAKLTSWSPTTFVGYNSMTFGESLLRQALYKTLHNPYLTNRDGNSRSDVERMAHACTLFAPNCLTIPTDGAGQLSFQLQIMAAANGFALNRAEGAMGDVLATIHLCRMIAENAPDVWSAFMQFSQKAAVLDFIANENVFCVTEFFYGRVVSYLVTVIGQNQKNANEWYLYNLDIDPGSIEGLPDDLLAARLAQWPRPVRRLRSNGAPMLFSADQAPDGSRGLDLGMDELNRRATLLRQNKEFCARLVAGIEAGRPDFPVSPHVEKQIYDGFFQQSDEALMDQFHRVQWTERSQVIDGLQDPRLRTLGRRLLYLERPDLFAPSTRSEWQAAMNRRTLDGDGPWRTLTKALGEIADLQTTTADPYDRALLLEYDTFLRERLARAGALSHC